MAKEKKPVHKVQMTEQRNGPCHSETGEKSMVSFRLCMMEGCLNK